MPMSRAWLVERVASASWELITFRPPLSPSTSTPTPWATLEARFNIANTRRQRQRAYCSRRWFFFQHFLSPIPLQTCDGMITWGPFSSSYLNHADRLTLQPILLSNVAPAPPRQDYVDLSSLPIPRRICRPLRLTHTPCHAAPSILNGVGMRTSTPCLSLTASDVPSHAHQTRSRRCQRTVGRASSLERKAEGDLEGSGVSQWQPGGVRSTSPTDPSFTRHEWDGARRQHIESEEIQKRILEGFSSVWRGYRVSSECEPLASSALASPIHPTHPSLQHIPPYSQRPQTLTLWVARNHNTLTPNAGVHGVQM
ncbi:hypothetical protein NMY22_g14430 [Coprinellus aureogranulatus]|nr:hypothetical protein NMY22_g14430 [Coprinellus aureogranulatus]